MSLKVKETFCQASFERVLLSYCADSIDNYYTISTRIGDRDFLDSDHKMIWVIMGSLIKRGVKKLDATMITSEAEANGVLKKIGGYEYITAIMNLEKPAESIEYYIDRVLDRSTRYQLYEQTAMDLKRLGDQAKDEDATAEDALARSINTAMTLSMNSKSVRDAVNAADGLDEYIEERREHPIEYSGISTGYPILDRRIDGLVPGTLTVVCARPKTGKTTLLSNIGAHVAYELSKPVLFVGTEDSFNDWRSRLLSLMSGVPERRIKHGGYSDQEYYNIKQAKKLIQGGKLFHAYMPGYSIDKLVAIYKKYKHVEGIELAIFDYIKAPAGADFAKKKEYQVLGDVTTALHDLAGELEIPFLCANQINREGDIADSDRILRYADVLMFFMKKKREELEKIHPYETDYGWYKLWIKDSRRGVATPEDGIGYNFYKKYLKISECPKQIIDYESKDEMEPEEIENDDVSAWEEPDESEELEI